MFLSNDKSLFPMINNKSKNPNATTIEGHLEHITYFNEETHYTIAKMKPSNLETAITVVGYLAGVSLGETIKPMVLGKHTLNSANSLELIPLRSCCPRG